MELDKNKLAERIKLHLQTPAQDGQAQYDKEGPNDQENCACMAEMKAIMDKHRAGHAEPDGDEY